MEVLVGYVLPLVILFGVFWLFLIRPQKKQQKEHQEMLANLETGDKVVTIGGIKGKVIKIKDDIIRLRVSSNVDIDFVKNAIARLDNTEDEE
ncbi:preprotein translocase subunit YajC [Halothermothrix orenii]|uniref:Preprotein translocase, YajC subunit n=1 Tax=Halothermothrix orenii (strain H 168 / OCM 544 / DSM 9562) TaxID=373903 RepID=B8CXF9_HALOH|nr:preprotein translocase subunit YajC [Halothermothrix orenii]ACL69978.1 preprotein translocase, YajC subunit [Halothermothrix orenii H 168]